MQNRRDAGEESDEKKEGCRWEKEWGVVRKSLEREWGEMREREWRLESGEWVVGETVRGIVGQVIMAY